MNYNEKSKTTKFLVVQRIVIIIIILTIIILYTFRPFNTKINKEDILDKNLTVTSSAFNEGGLMPKKYSGLGEEISPPLEINFIHPMAKSIAIVMDDPDAPLPITIIHWVLWNIPVEYNKIPENISHSKLVKELGNAHQGKRMFGKVGYMGPNPPFGTHRYRFHIYTLDSFLELDAGAKLKQLNKKMEGHILQYALFTGKFSR
jgi:hypothetical protein